MSANYLVPSILYLPPGTECVVPVPWSQVGERLIDGVGRVQWYARAVCAGAIVNEVTGIVEFAGGACVGAEPSPFVWRSDQPPLDRAPGFMEFGVRALDNAPVFADKQPLAFYSIYSVVGRKSYFSDNAWKYASPPVIAQIAEYGRFLDAYPAVRIDRDRDAGMSLILINPYLKAVLARVVAADGRSIDRVRVPPQSALAVPLARLLHDDERAWAGQIQITANNRLVTYITWHSLADPTLIGDQEHLDPYRGEPTYIPAFQRLRQWAGLAIRDLLSVSAKQQ